MTGMKQIKLPWTRGFRWRAVITSNDSIRRPGIPRQKSGLKYPQSLQSFLSMNHINIKKKISVNSSVRFNSFWNETGHLTREKLAQSRHAIRLAGVYSVDFDLNFDLVHTVCISWPDISTKIIEKAPSDQLCLLLTFPPLPSVLICNPHWFASTQCYQSQPTLATKYRRGSYL